MFAVLQATPLQLPIGAQGTLGILCALIHCRQQGGGFDLGGPAPGFSFHALPRQSDLL
jgi:hypothetical protein